MNTSEKPPKISPGALLGSALVTAALAVAGGVLGLAWGARRPLGSMPADFMLMGCLAGLVFGFPIAGAIGLFVKSNTRSPSAGFATAALVAFLGTVLIMYVAAVSIFG